jgi:hypothetical protein
MAVDRLSSGKHQHRMIFFAQRRKGAKKVGLISRLRASRENQRWKWRIPANAMPNPAAAILAFDLTVVMDESGNDLAGNISLRRRCTAANSKP